MKRATLAMVCALAITTVGAQESQTDYNFLRLPVSAHVAALGGENVTLPDDDASMIFHNPALISNVSDRTLDLNVMTYMSGSTTASASFVKAVKEKGTWGVMAQYMDYGEMKETTADNIQTGTFHARDICIGGSFAYLLTPRLTGGISAKLITSYIGQYNSMAMGVDLGLNYYDQEREWSLSAVAKNLGGQIKAYDDDFEAIPLDLIVGVTKRVTNAPFRLSATMGNLNHWGGKFINHFNFGVDVLLSDEIYIAGGYNFRRSNEMLISDDEDESNHGAGLSLGAGLMLERFKLHLAWAKYHVSASSLLINLSFSL